MDEKQESPESGKRVGLHPIIVIFGVIIGLWIFIQAIIPKSRDIQPPQAQTQKTVGSEILESASHALVPTFKVAATIPEMNAVSLLVPPQTTDSQIVALLRFLRDSRQDGTLASLIAPTLPDNEVEPFAIADMYIFSEETYARREAIQILAVGAHAPGEFYSSTIPYEAAMEHVRGHYLVDLNNKVAPEKATLGFGEEATGLYSKRYQVVF